MRRRPGHGAPSGWTLALALAAGCGPALALATGCGPADHRPRPHLAAPSPTGDTAVDRPGETGAVGDTGDSGDLGSAGGSGWTYPPWKPTCPRAPCAFELADVRFTDPASPGLTGHTLAATGAHLLVGAATASPSGGGLPRVYVLTADLTTIAGTWQGDDPGDYTGGALAAADVTGDGELELSIGAPGEETPDSTGAAYLTSGLPTGDLALGDVASAVFRAEQHSYVGLGAALLSLDGSGAPTWIVGAPGAVWPSTGPVSGAVYGLDPGLTGAVGPEDATWAIEGDAGFGLGVHGWDGDGDGIDDLVTTDAGDAVVRFASPLTAVVPELAETRWTTTGPEPDLVPLGNLGDLTGDGLPDLGLGDRTSHAAADRGGSAFVVPGGDLTSRDVGELVLQWHGTEVDETWGASMTSGDLDGDGQLDLVIGADGLSLALPGLVTGYLGPVTSLDPSVAAFQVFGSDDDGFFGASTAAADADGDGSSDLYVGAPFEEHHLGAVYLFLSASLLP